MNRALVLGGSALAAVLIATSTPAHAVEAAGASTAPAVGAAAAGTPDGAVADRVEQVRVAGRDWRAELTPYLTGLPQWDRTVSVTEPVSGLIVAGTVRLPATVHVNGDLTIIADTVEFAGSTPRVIAPGHAVTLLPVAEVRAGPAVPEGPEGPRPDATIAATITVDTTGTPGATGTGGRAGQQGSAGSRGMRGTACGQAGGPGGHGLPAVSPGGNGGPGATGGQGGPISIDIPAGSTDRYDLRAFGGRGGTGGRGGNGGRGLQGGGGGQGGNGGRGGNITVFHPASGYDPSWIAAHANGGQQGNGGDSGAGGAGGAAGPGGLPGVVPAPNCGSFPCIEGTAGEPGEAGLDGPSNISTGTDGAPGPNGTVVISPVVPPQVNAVVSPNVPPGQPYSAERIQRNTIVAIFGSQFRAVGNTVEVQQGGTTHEIRAGTPGWWESTSQINAVMPAGLQIGAAQVLVRHSGGPSNLVTINVVDLTPQINPGGVVNPNDWTQNNIRPGSLVAIFGDHFTSFAPSPGVRVRVTQGGNQWELQTGSPGWFDSPVQINVILPAGLQPGTAQIQVINVNGRISSPAPVPIVP